MKTTESLKHDIKKSLLTLVQKHSDERVPGQKLIRVPEDLLTEKPGEDEEHVIALNINQEIARENVITALLEIPEMEYASEKEATEKIDRLICEFEIGGKKYKDKNALGLKVDEFFGEVLRPLVSYEVYIGLKNLVLIKPSVNLGGVVIFKPTGDFLQEFESNLSKSIPLEKIQAAAAVLALTVETGNHPDKIKYRARQRLLEKLSLVKIAFQKERFLHEDWIDIELSEFTFFKRISDPQRYSWSWSRKETPDEIHFGSDDHLLRFIELDNGINKLSKSFSNNFRMALHWVNLAYMEPNYDLKQIFLCTAMESILSYRGDKKKGAIIALRMFTVATHFGGTFVAADLFYRLYEERSFLVHGSRTTVFAEKNYTSLLLEVQNTIRNTLKICEDFMIKSQSDLFKKLHELPSREKVINYIKRFQNEENESILKELEIP